MEKTRVCIYCKRAGVRGFKRDAYGEAWQCISMNACGRRRDQAMRHIWGL